MVGALFHGQRRSAADVGPGSAYVDTVIVSDLHPASLSDAGGSSCRAMAQTLGRMMLGPGISLPGPQPINQAHVNCVINAYHARAAMLRSKLTGDALAESQLSPEQHAELQAALTRKGFFAPSRLAPELMTESSARLHGMR
jgi:hypothetical protein